MTCKKYLGFGILLFLTLLVMNSVYALAVSSPYWNDNPLTISPGESKDFQLVLKNNAGAEEVTVTAEISQGADIAVITDAVKTYTAPAGGDAVINLRVSVSPESPLGGSYPVKLSFKTVTSGNQGGAVGIGSAIDQNIPVVIVEKPKAPATNNTTWYLVVGVIILVVIIALVMMRKKR
jgi:LPXTG-motif cell wall-anchored protein